MTTITHNHKTTSPVSPFIAALIANFLWINASEVFRYFIFVMPMMRSAFPMLPDVAPMNLSVFMIWSIWDTILVLTATLLPSMAMKLFGASAVHAILYGTGAWMAVFVILWLGLFNMNLATTNVLAIALPMAWIEMVIAALIAWWFATRDRERIA
ncbi:hypothetical protein RSK20926_12109 [Roseobacter sp. SK209-2-6]|uniref:hypothetical protein n=1 Tax=Roseobacter sp. SK209-2-6 TaxID=388739 RepID=UPI0000F3C615|nr:hypothetical protein [Roseobacter sp. SK209-2-6]EBA18463.1 hypothetical protein RSK20926_12109 [Roseobacter sp. SK209-2-6]